ncbi:MAG: hypothetical protein OEX19_13235 [Gammaproteobacteria bacterium]|nr:hypothetical protein [Gammaproteobacteria bacterium]
MKQTIVIIGMGEMGGVFARGFLRSGYPVYPITRNMDIDAEVARIPDPALVLLAVGEGDLHASLEIIPAAWRDKLALLQNELLPRDWKNAGYDQPTVISVWFEKKKGQDVKVLISSPAFGPGADLLLDAMSAVDIDACKVASAEEMAYELVRKNVYILTTNIAGLECGGTVESLWNEHQALAREVAGEVMDIQQWLTGTELDRERLIDGFVEGINGDLAHQCMGRSAPSRLKRALGFADEAGLAVPKLRAIFAAHVS